MKLFLLKVLRQVSMNVGGGKGGGKGRSKRPELFRVLHAPIR